MKTVRLRDEVHNDLLKVSGQIQNLMAERTTASIAIHILIEFQAVNKALFEEFLKTRKPFGEDYLEKLNEMRLKGIPTTRDFVGK